MHLMLCLSTLSIHTLVFVALTQHLMQVWNICIKWPLAPAKKEGYCIVWAFRLGGLAVHQSVRGGSFVNFLGLVKLQGWLQARHTANPQFLKLKGAQQPGNSYISMEQSCILHTLTNCLPVLNFDLKSIFSAWRTWACTIPLELAGSVLCKVRSHEQVDVPIHRLQHQMLGCQVTQTCLSLIAHTWPWFYPSRSCTPCVPPAQLTNKLVWAWQIQ